jgi:hypothetical protein
VILRNRNIVAAILGLLALYWIGFATLAQGPQVQVGKPGIPISSFTPGGYVSGGNNGASSSTAVNQGAIYIPFTLTFGNITVDVTTGDGSNASSFGIHTLGGKAVCTTTAATQPSTGAWKQACSQGTVTAAPGLYVFDLASAGTTLKIAFGGTTLLPFSSATSATTTTGGQVPSTIAAPTSGAILSGYAEPIVLLN